MSRLSRVVALLLMAAAVVLAIVAFSVGRQAHVAPPMPVTLAPTPPPGHPLVVATTVLPAGRTIEASALHIASWSELPEGAVDRIDAIAGHTPIRDIAPGAAVTTLLLAQGIALELQPGERALAVPVDETVGVGNRVAPGDYVDVFFSLKQVKNAQPETQARLLLSRLRVLAYGADAAAKPAEHVAARTAVLAVPIDEVNGLLLAVQDGKLSLALRHPLDRDMPDVALFAAPRPVLPASGSIEETTRPENLAFAGIDIHGLAGEKQDAQPLSPRPVRLRGSGRGVEIIRGTQRASLSMLVDCGNTPGCSP